LTYHVLPAQALAADLDLFQAVTTVQGKLLHVTKWGGVVKVGPSLRSSDLRTVVAADNLASNGVAHIIDGVLIPPSASLASSNPNIVELAESVESLATLVSAVVAGDLVDTLSSAGPFTVFAPTTMPDASTRQWEERLFDLSTSIYVCSQNEHDEEEAAKSGIVLQSFITTLSRL